MVRGSWCVLAGVALLCACTTPDSQVAVRYYTPSEIIVPTSNSGTFEAAGGCIFFRYERHQSRRVAALFPPGSRLSQAGGAVVLPNGQSIPFNRRVTIAYERPPNRRFVDETCGSNPIQVLNLLRRD